MKKILAFCFVIFSCVFLFGEELDKDLIGTWEMIKTFTIDDNATINKFMGITIENTEIVFSLENKGQLISNNDKSDFMWFTIDNKVSLYGKDKSKVEYYMDFISHNEAIMVLEDQERKTTSIVICTREE